MNIKTFSIHSVRNVFAFFIALGIGYVAYTVNPTTVAPTKVEAGTSQNISGWAWSKGAGISGDQNTGIGWISFNSTNETGASLDYGVNVNTSAKATGGAGLFSGRAWSENVGWISFNQSELTGCPTSPCKAEVNWSTGSVTGWARVMLSASDYTGWDGWISLSGMTTEATPKPYGVKISGNKFSGYAWGSDVIGWVDFAPVIGGISVGVQVAAPPCTATDVPAGSWGTCTPLNQCPTTSTAGIQVGVCPGGGTVTRSCSAPQTCPAPSAGTKPKFWQF